MLNRIFHSIAKRDPISHTNPLLTGLNYFRKSIPLRTYPSSAKNSNQLLDRALMMARKNLDIGMLTTGSTGLIPTNFSTLVLQSVQTL